MDSSLLESIVSNWLWSVAKEHLITKRENQWPDFELRDPDDPSGGTRLLIELKTMPPSEAVLQKEAERLRSRADGLARFVLVTPDAPSPAAVKWFRQAFAQGPNQTDWVTLEDLPARLGFPSPGPWNLPETWSSLQTSALVKGLEAYGSAPIGPGPYAAQRPTGEMQDLTRQFSYDMIARLSEMPGALESHLGLGSRRENVTVVLSDIVNFSSLVTASRPDDLKEAMAQYYQQARQAVFDHFGMLDKFIGDAVLAVFGYPLQASDAAIHAIRFGQALTAIGRSVLDDWSADLNADIPTGTRIGIATGDIWPINIGTQGIEIALLGDTINLASRLEKNCEVDKLLIDNRTHTAGQHSDPDYIADLALQQIIIKPENAKGQAFPIRAWALP